MKCIGQTEETNNGNMEIKYEKEIFINNKLSKEARTNYLGNMNLW